MIAYKVFTHTLCPPVQGGPPIWDGALPFALPPVVVDRGSDACAAGWNACRRPETALRIAGLWPGGRPSRLFVVEAGGTDGGVVERDDKLRAATWTVREEILDVRPAVRALSEPFGAFAEEMASEQMAWRAALARPRHDEAAVVEGLTQALAARSLPWKLRRFDSVQGAWDAGAWDAGAAWDAWDAWDAGAAGAAWDAWAAGDAGAARDAWDAWDAWNAWSAGDALTVYYVARRGWISCAPDKLTVGLRDAYASGLGSAWPTGPQELGWAME